MKFTKIIYIVIFLLFPISTYASEDQTEAMNKKIAEEPDFSNYSKKLQRKYKQRYKDISENDLDGDGKVSVEELKERAKKRSTEIDANKDGVITKDEIDAYANLYVKKSLNDPENTKGNKIIERQGKILKRKLRRMDINKDGTITAEEMEKYQEIIIKKRDKDKDGMLDFKEYRVDTEKNKSNNRKKRKPTNG